jgi:peroxiredoxin
MLSPRRCAQLGLSGAVLLAVVCVALLAAGAAEDKRLMAGHPGASAPDFALHEASDPAGRIVRLSDLRGSVVVAYFCSIRCPVSNDYDERIAKLSARYAKDGRVKFLAIHCGSAAQSPMEVAVQSSVAGLHFPHLLDSNGAVASQYGVQQTPTFLVIDRAGKVQYRGALDDSREIERVTQHYLESAISEVLAGRPVRLQASNVNGCEIR